MLNPFHRRFLQFRVRTLLALVTVLSLYFSWQVGVVRERKAAMQHLLPMWSSAPERISWVRRALGDAGFSQLFVKDDADLPTFLEMRRLFPEASVQYVCAHPIKLTPEYQQAVESPVH